MSIDYRPLIVIGAARSGTNMLRDALCTLPGFATWPCDEINPIWKHGHLNYPYDDIAPERANDKVRAFVRERFSWVVRRYGARVVVEKTCANSLRVAYLRALLPEARFVWIHRDGFDAVASAASRWQSPIDWGYTLRKVRFVPLRDVPHHAWRYLRSRATQLRDVHHRLPVWGPMTAEVESLARDGRFGEAVATQWVSSVVHSMSDLADAERYVVRTSYEEFVRHPRRELKKIADFVDEPYSERDLLDASKKIYGHRVGRGMDTLRDNGLLESVAPIIQPLRRELGYSTNEVAGAKIDQLS